MKKLLLFVAAVLCGSLAMMPSIGGQTAGHMPIIVAERTFSNQTTSIPTTTLLTPPASGTYRITTYTDDSNNYGSYSPVPFVYWTDDFASNQAEIPSIAVNNVGTAGWSTGQITFRAVANQPIQFSISESPNELGVYDAYITVERL